MLVNIIYVPAINFITFYFPRKQVMQLDKEIIVVFASKVCIFHGVYLQGNWKICVPLN